MAPGYIFPSWLAATRMVLDHKNLVVAALDTTVALGHRLFCIYNLSTGHNTLMNMAKTYTSLFSKQCSVVVQQATYRQARGREIGSRNSLLLFVALGHILLMWPWATNFSCGLQPPVWP